MDYMPRLIDEIETPEGSRAITIKDIDEYTRTVFVKNGAKSSRDAQRQRLEHDFPQMSLFTESLKRIGGDPQKHMSASYTEAMQVLKYARIISTDEESLTKHGLTRARAALGTLDNVQQQRAPMRLTFDSDGESWACTFQIDVHAPYAIWLQPNIEYLSKYGQSANARILLGTEEASLPTDPRRWKAVSTHRLTRNFKLFDPAYSEYMSAMSSDDIYTFEVEAFGDTSDEAISCLFVCLCAIHLGDVCLYPDYSGRLGLRPLDRLSSLWLTTFDTISREHLHTGFCSVCGDPFATKSPRRERCDRCSSWERQSRHKGIKRERKMY